MELRSLIGKLQSPSFRTVVAIAQHAGSGMTVERLKSIRFPVGTVQVWEFIPRLPPLDRKPCVVTVLTRKHLIVSWAPSVIQDFEGSITHFTRLAAETWEKARALATDRETSPTSPTPVSAASPAPTRIVAIPGLPAGVRITTTGRPLTLGGQPVTVATAVPVEASA